MCIFLLTTWCFSWYLFYNISPIKPHHFDHQYVALYTLLARLYAPPPHPPPRPSKVLNPRRAPPPQQTRSKTEHRYWVFSVNLVRLRREFEDFVGLECDTLVKKMGMNGLSFKKVVMTKEGVVVRAEGRQANGEKGDEGEWPTKTKRA